MLFPTFEFFAFFTAGLILNWFLKRWPLVWRLFLLFASYYFYSVWDINFLLVLIPISFFNFITAKAIYFLNKDKFLFILAVIGNLSFLGLFKYYDFFRVSAELLLEKIGFSAIFPTIEIILPLGLSFYILRMISYNGDVYLGKIKPTSSLLDFFIYVAFFPYLLAGPIVRAGDFLSQLKDGGAKKIDNLYENFTLIFIGLLKKLIIASYLACNFVDDVFAVPENHSSLIILLAVFAYSLVIYFDFSGYSDMAIGFAGLLGFKSPINFDLPYLATNLREFWRRWHITLSNWARDYIYIPLGGNRVGKIRKYLNLITTMILIGLWHGAGNHFIIWGAFHGLGLTTTYFYQDMKKIKLNPDQIKKWKEVIKKFFCWLFTFSFISFSWVFFRSENTELALSLIKNMIRFQKVFEPFEIYILFLIIFGFLFFFLEKEIINKLVAFQKKLPLAIWFLFLIFIFIILFGLSSDTLPSFIYFSF